MSLKYKNTEHDVFINLKPAIIKMDAILEEWIHVNVPLQFREFVSDALNPGRRLRSALFLLLASISHCKSLDELLNVRPLTKNICLSIEILHRAGIIVDDIIDCDISRRGYPTFVQQYGVDIAILIAHFLTAESLRLATEVNGKYLKRLSNTYLDMCGGQITDIKWTIYGGDPYRVYRQTVLKKTNSLFRLLFETLADYAGKSTKSKTFANVGEQLGDLYQMANDYYDFGIADIGERGKKKKHKINLNLVMALAIDDNKLVKNSIGRSIGKVLSNTEYIKIINNIKLHKYSVKAKKVLNYEHDRLKKSISKMPGCYHEVISSLASLIVQDFYWNHSETERSGYGVCNK